MIFKLSYLNSNLALTLGYLNPALNNSAQVGRGGKRYSTKFYIVTLRPEVQLRTLLYTIFSRKGTPFVYLLSTTGHPFHIPSLELFIPLNYYKCTFFKR